MAFLLWITLVGGGSAAAAEDEDLKQTTDPAWKIIPRISLTETFTDNANLNSGPSGRPHADQITQISPGIRIDGKTARLQVFADYSLSAIDYAQDSRGSQMQNALNSLGTFEAIEKWGYLDFSGTVAQTSISALGTPSTTNASTNGNSTETATFKLSPYVKGRFGEFADYRLRYERMTTRSKSSLANDTDSDIWDGTLQGTTGLAALGWNLNLNRQQIERTIGRSNEAERLNALLSWLVQPQFKLKASAGRERNEYATLDMKSYSTHGVGFEWAPTERTNLSAFKERRFFGDGHQISFTHRTPLSSWRYTDSRDVNVNAQGGQTSLGTWFDFALATVPATITDPVERARLAQRLLDMIGKQAQDIIPANFLASQSTLMRRRELSFVITGATNTITLLASRSHQQTLINQTILELADTFSSSNVIDQKGISATWSHRLTPLSSLSVAATKTNTSGKSGTTGTPISTQQRSLNVSYSTRLGAKTNASLGLRRTLFDSETASGYTENALTGALTAQF